MKKAYNNLELLPERSRVFLKSFDIDVQEVNPLTDDGKPLFLIKTNTGHFVLKTILPPTKLVDKLRSVLLPSLGFQQECLIYKKIHKFDCIGNYAEYISNDKYNLLIGFLPKNEVSYDKFKDEKWKLVIKSLSDFQWCNKFLDTSFKSGLHRFI